MMHGSMVPLAILRDAALRAAPQDEVVKQENPHPEEPGVARATRGVSKDGPPALKATRMALTRPDSASAIGAGF